MDTPSEENIDLMNKFFVNEFSKGSKRYSND
jgi:hypothetical protein